MRFKLKQIALAGLLTCLGASAMAASYFFVQPKSMEMSKASPLSVALNPSALPEAVVGLAYNGGAGFDLKSVLAVSGDSGFNAELTTFSITSGTLPSGLTVSATGVLSGTPTVASAGSSIQVTASYKTASGAQTYQVIALNLTVTLAPATLPSANVGSPYNNTGYNFKPQLTVTGDSAYTVGQVAFKLDAGSTLPDGLALSANGILSGTPTATTAGASFTVQAAYKLKTGQQAYTIVVNGAILQVLSVATRNNTTCAVTTLGGAKCWGSNGQGQLGIGNTVNQSTPVTVTGFATGVSSIAVGEIHSCALTTSGGVYCWGSNGQGQLGDNTSIQRSAPVVVSGLGSGVVSISVGVNHACAVTVAGALVCWGLNGAGRLGDGTTNSRAIPTPVGGLATGVASVSAGNLHTCAVTTAGGAKCWGQGNNGQVGDGQGLTVNLLPLDVSGLASGVASISAGGADTCAVLTTGGVKCWGFNYYGEVGDNTTIQRNSPVDVTGLLTGVARVSVGNYHSCALTAAGGVKCWGYNNRGQLGDGTTANKKTPTDVIGLTSGVSSLAAGEVHSCAGTATGLKCWGYNTYGQLGDNTLTQRNTAVAVLP